MQTSTTKAEINESPETYLAANKLDEDDDDYIRRIRIWSDH